MAKKLTAFLEVSLDDLLSTEELEKVAERNQIIEKPFMKYVLLTQSIVFIYGFIMSLKGNLTPRKTGMIMAVYFVFLCLTSGRMSNIGLEYTDLKWNTVIEDLMLIIPSILGAAAAYQFFCKAKKESVWYWSLIVVSCWEILLILPITHSYIRAAAEICVYLLVIYQAYIMRQKRKHAMI